MLDPYPPILLPWPLTFPWTITDLLFLYRMCTFVVTKEMVLWTGQEKASALPHEQSPKGTCTQNQQTRTDGDCGLMKSWRSVRASCQSALTYEPWTIRLGAKCKENRAQIWEELTHRNLGKTDLKGFMGADICASSCPWSSQKSLSDPIAATKLLKQFNGVNVKDLSGFIQ